jgi:signal transduction histidine kinase
VVRRRLRGRLEDLRRRHAVETERGRIARDIHDQLGTGLTEIALLGDLLRVEAECCGSSPENAAGVANRARELARAMDETVWAINPSNDSLDSLLTYLAHSMGEWLRHAGVRCRLDLPDDTVDLPLSAEQRNHLYLACKETVHNAVKHARATEISLRVERTADALRITISDDGCGFDVGAARPRGNGLNNLRQRMCEIGGSLDLRSQPGQGTVVALHLPLPNDSGTSRGG